MFTVSNSTNVCSILNNWCVGINISCGGDAAEDLRHPPGLRAEYYTHGCHILPFQPIL